MLKAIIIDDEKESIEALSIKLGYCSVPVQIERKFTSPLKALPVIQSTKFDILFLDVDMPHMTGIELLEQISERDFEVIMVTAYSEYALKALKARALDYLLKPVDIDELEVSLQKTLQNKTNKNSNLELIEQLSNLSSMIQTSHPEINKIALNSLNETHYVKIDDIIYIHGENNYSTFHLTNNQKIVVSKTLKEYESALNNNLFFRTHKSYIINLNHVSKINKNADLTVSMSSGDTVCVATRKKSELVEALKNFNT